MQRSRGGRILGAEVLTSWEGRARTITPGRDCAPESHTRRRGVCLRDSDAFSRGRVLRMGGRQVSAPRSWGGPVRRFLTLSLKMRRTGRGVVPRMPCFTRHARHLRYAAWMGMSCGMPDGECGEQRKRYLCGQTQWKIFSSSTVSAFGYGKARPMS